MFLNFLVPDFQCAKHQFLIFEGLITVSRNKNLSSYIIRFEDLKVKDDNNMIRCHYQHSTGFLLLDGNSQLSLSIASLFADVKPNQKYRGYLDLTQCGLSKLQIYLLTNSSTLKSQLKELFFELIEVSNNV